MNLDLQLVYLISLIGSAGFFGGVVSAIFDLHSYMPLIADNATVRDCSDCRWKFSFMFERKRILWTFLGRGFIGIAGSFSIMLVGLWVGKVTPDMNQGNQIFIFSLAVVSGTVSYRMLPKIGHKLEEQILRQKMAETEQSARTESKKAIDFTSALSAADTALNRENYHEMPQAIQMLESLRPAFATHRTLHIYLGRLYRRFKQYDKAIEVLRDFINAMERDKTKDAVSASGDADIAAAYYNIACYHVLKALNSSTTEKERLIDEGLAALKVSITKDPRGIEKAKADEDFRSIHAHPRFVELTASGGEGGTP